MVRARRTGMGTRRVRADALKSTARVKIDASGAAVPLAWFGEREWMDKGWVAIDATNTSAWQTFVDKVSRESAADVVLVQETKLVKGRVDGAERVVYRAGWRMVFEPCVLTELGYESCGAAVGCKRGWGIVDMTAPIRTEGMEGRFSIARVGGIVPGGVHCGSLYCKDAKVLVALINGSCAEWRRHLSASRARGLSARIST